MKRKNLLDGKKVIARFKKSLKIKTDVELSKVLGVLPSTISTWKKRNSLDHALLIELCTSHKIDLNYLFFGEHPVHAENHSRTFLVNKLVLHEYIMGALKGKLDSLPTCTFPFVKNGSSRAFQVSSGNMLPLVEENAWVVCEKTTFHNIQEKEVLVFISRKKGFFLNRVKKIEGEKLLLTNDNPSHDKNNRYLEVKYIDEFWSVTAILNTNMKERKPNGANHHFHHEEIHNALIKKERELIASSLRMTNLKNEIKNILKTNGAETPGNVGNIASILRAVSGKNDAWGYFMKKFVDVHPGFVEKIEEAYPELSKNDIDFCSLILLGLSNKEIGTLLNITHQSVITKKYRLRRKMNFSEGQHSLEKHLNGFK